MTQRRIFLLWLPLAASWALMTLEAPVIYAAIARLERPETMLAAAGIVISLEVTIESPVIMLLATSTALARSPAAYDVLRRFTLHLNLALTAIAAIVAFVQPAFDAVVPGLMGIPPGIAVEVQPGLQVMVLWTAAIGWRRFCQGVLIRFGRTREVTYGTTIRLVSAVTCAIGLLYLDVVSGVLLGACAWMAAVLSEVVYAHFAARRVVREHLTEGRAGAAVAPEGEDDPTYFAVARYHAPLAATAVLSLLTMPIIGAALARMPDPERNLAAWPVLFGILLFFRSPGLALPETVIALFDGRATVAPLRRFCWTVGFGVAAVFAVFAATAALPWLLEGPMAVEPELIAIVVPGAIAAILIPFVQAVQSWLRGVLMSRKLTDHVYYGNCVALATMVTCLWAGVSLDVPGVLGAVASVTVAMVAEALYLAWGARRAART